MNTNTNNKHLCFGGNSKCFRTKMRENEQIVKVVQVKEIKRLPESVVNRVAAGEVLLYSFSLFFFFVFFLLLKRLVFLVYSF
jgi:hypothetical protein